LGKNLGEGKFGTVYQAFDRRTKGVYAFKKIPKLTIKSHWMIDQFLLEVKIQQFCNHPNILSLHGVFEDTEHVYILLEYMEEGTLFLHLKKNTTLN
jgi:aurora kinase